MKKRTSLGSILIAFALFCSAQVPQKFNYQAVVRDAQQGLITDQDVGFRLSILEGAADGAPVYVETHMVSTNSFGLADLEIGEGSVVSGTFTDIPWGEKIFFLKVEMDPAGGSAYEHVGTSQLISVPYALYSANLSSPTQKFTIQETEDHPVDSALFEVRNAEGQTVFAVYPEGTRIYILDEEAKGKKGGFAVGGYSRTTKGITQEYMRVTPDSIRMYFREPVTKGKKGGFAVGGYSQTSKGLADQYFILKPDSARFTLFTDQDDGKTNLLSVVTKPKDGLPDEGGGLNLFNLSRDNYFIGHRAGESITDGVKNCFIGFESGTRTTVGYGNIFIGERSGSENTEGSFNAFIGYEAGLKNTAGLNNVSIGFAAGQWNTEGSNNIYIGSDAGYNATGYHNVYIGADAGSMNRVGNNNIMIGSAAGAQADTSLANIFIGSPSGLNNTGGVANVFLGNATGLENRQGSNNTFIGHETGHFNTDGSLNTFVGSYAGWKNETGESNVCLGNDAGNANISGSSNVYIGTRAGFNNITGKENVFIGFEAGMDETGDGKLLIDLFSHNSEEALIYGEFYNSKVRINNKLGVGMNADVNYALAVNGNAIKEGDANWDVTSDRRVKTDIHYIDSGLEQILKLRPVTFRYTDEWMEKHPGLKERNYYSFIAQEFAEVFPESVTTGQETLEGDPQQLLHMNSQPAQVVAIRAIQELAEQNKEQQAMIEQLQKENMALRQMYQDILSHTEIQ